MNKEKTFTNKFKLGDLVKVIKSRGNFCFSNAQVGLNIIIDNIDKTRNCEEFGYTPYISMGYCWRENELKLIKRQGEKFAREYTEYDEVSYKTYLICKMLGNNKT